jgi:hypothetical protein
MLNQNNKFYIGLLVFVLLLNFSIIGCGCNKSNYSYQLTHYSVENGNMLELPFNSYLVSYNGFLLEFKLNIRQSDTLYSKSERRINKTWYDTSGVYILDPKSKTYLEFDTFSMSGKIVNHGKFSEKKFGIALSDTLRNTVSFFQNKVLKDTFLWGSNLFYLDTLEKGKLNRDSILSHIFFIKDNNFTSLYELNSGVFPNPEYSMIGYCTYFFDTKMFLIGKLEDMRRLTKHEENICKRMIQKISK